MGLTGPRAMRTSRDWPTRNRVKGALTVIRTGPKQEIVAQEAPSVIKIEGRDFFGWTTTFYVGVFVYKLGDAVQVQVSKFYRSRAGVVEYGPSEGDYLRAIQRELVAGQPLL